MKCAIAPVVKAILLGLLCACERPVKPGATTAPPAALTAAGVLQALRAPPAAVAAPGPRTVVGIVASFDSRAMEEGRRAASACAAAGVAYHTLALGVNGPAGALAGDPAAFQAAGVRALPTYLVLDARGRILSRLEGYVPMEDLLAKVRP